MLTNSKATTLGQRCKQYRRTHLAQCFADRISRMHEVRLVQPIERVHQHKYVVDSYGKHKKRNHLKANYIQLKIIFKK